jgi:hypothetical protein
VLATGPGVVAPTWDAKDDLTAFGDLDIEGIRLIR